MDKENTELNNDVNEENMKLNNDVSENNKTNADKNDKVVDKKTKKRKFKKKNIVLAIILILIIFTLIIPFVIVQTGDWESRRGDEFDLRLNGELYLNNPGAGSPVGDSDLYDRYLFLNQYCIILYGQGKIGIMQIQCITPHKMTLKFGSEKIVFYDSKYYPYLHENSFRGYTLD